MDIAEYIKTSNLSQSEFAGRVGVTQGMVWQWIRGRRPVSFEACIRIEQATDGAVRCEDLRPDVNWAYLRRGARAEQTTAAA